MLSQFCVDVRHADKELLLFALIKLDMIRGKTLFFVNSIDR